MARRESFLHIPTDSDFPLENLPYGVFSTAADPARRVGVALGDEIVDLAVLARAGLLIPPDVFAQPTLNRFLDAGRTVWEATRAGLQHLLDAQTPTLRDDAALRAQAIVPQSAATLHLPVAIGDYTDFYSSRQHATNVGKMFRAGGEPLLPNWRHLPVAYHGRASSVVVSGTPIRRPWGQGKPADADAPIVAPTAEFDFELEIGAIIGQGNPLGVPIRVDRAIDHVFGVVLVNDWSARDIQRWEYAPLGPFTAKNLGTTISPWVVPLAALEPFRVMRPPQDPPPPAYLQHDQPCAYDIALEVVIETPTTQATIARSNARYLYWDVAQQIAHHTISGCDLRPGDLIASGTISGDDPDTYGSLLELTWRGTRPIALPDGSTRTFLEDGDAIVLRGAAGRDGVRIGFGEARGVIVPALDAAFFDRP